MQLHCASDRKEDRKFAYSISVPKSGKYALSATVVTLQANQKLLVTVNDSEEQAELALPFTVGRWEQSNPVVVTLVNGDNAVSFTRPAPGRGVTIKEFTLTPVP